jgi:hypothetical protein
MKRCITIIIALGLFGCNEDDTPVSGAAVNTVHLAGSVSPYGNGDKSPVASYWEDSVFTALTPLDSFSNVTSLYVDGSSVVIGGIRDNADSELKSVVWRNGSETVVDEAFGTILAAERGNNFFGVWLEHFTGWVFHKNGMTQPLVDTAHSFWPNAFALMGDDMYISGASSGPATPPTFSPPQHAQCWKNGQLIFRETEASNALAIFIHEDDVYMAGHIYTPGEPMVTACYWKNGERINLTDGTVNAIAKSIFVTGDDVYVAGMIDNQAVYWKDGEPVVLTTGEVQSMANAIFVKGNNVHVGGHEQSYPAYWKNDVKQNIQNQDIRGQIKFVVVGEN